MWFDASAALAELGGERETDTQPPATIATSATLRARVAIVADVATPLATTATPATSAKRTAPIVAKVARVATPPTVNPNSDHSRHGLSVAGHPLTWTGRVVSLDEWRKLTAWERHGPDGRLWCGINHTWKKSEKPEET